MKGGGPANPVSPGKNTHSHNSVNVITVSENCKLMIPQSADTITLTSSDGKTVSNHQSINRKK